jgi:putative oxidoreductase
MYKLFASDKSWTGLILRFALGIVMIPHGAQKLLGWFGGPGFSQTLSMMNSYMHLPSVLVVLIIVLEFFGALGLIFGFLTRIIALSFFGEMLGAIAMVHLKNGFFMNWTGKQAGEGFEYHLLVLGISLALIIAGAGRCSLDRLIAGRLPAQRF